MLRCWRRIFKAKTTLLLFLGPTMGGIISLLDQVVVYIIQNVLQPLTIPIIYCACAATTNRVPNNTDARMMSRSLPSTPPRPPRAL